MEKPKVWKYFTKTPKEGLAQCLKCPKKISTKGSNTTGLVRHLEHIHKISIKNTETQASTSAGYSADNRDEQPSDSKKSKSKLQKTLHFEPKNKQSLGEIVAVLAAKDGLTIRQITKSDFIRESLRLRGINLPKNESDVMKIILKYYEEKKQETIDFLSNSKQKESARFNLSVDEWSSLRNRRYFNICIHHTDSNFYNLGLVYIPGQCRAVEIKEIIKHRLEEFGLYFEQDVVAVTSDGPNVMVKFGRENPTEMVLCLNHAVHLAVLETFCKKNETNENFTSNQDSDNLSGEESEYDEDNCDLEPEIRTNYTQNIDKALQDTRALVKLFRKSPLKNITLQKHVK
ncbi:hypothetical protein EVAR_52339_1 [Eumeta japonica]|uniref:BED-type domain-containing protein n=1 Tax=Eumeta variegata TaxID=151549 RepID=A0A4C1Y486_EUMVA|nr:hypothetical protein EVAR_52339_1 [Eumeta japonica]